MKKVVGFISILFLFNIQTAFAADYQVIGKVVDSQNQTVAGSSITFTNQSGNKVASGLTGQDGTYMILLPNGTYTVLVKAPLGINAPDIVHAGQIISGNSTLNFTLMTAVVSTPTMPNKRSVTKTSQVWVVMLIIILISISGVIYYLLKRRRNSSQSQTTPIA